MVPPVHRYRSGIYVCVRFVCVVVFIRAWCVAAVILYCSVPRYLFEYSQYRRTYRGIQSTRITRSSWLLSRSIIILLGLCLGWYGHLTATSSILLQSARVPLERYSPPVKSCSPVFAVITGVLECRINYSVIFRSKTADVTSICEIWITSLVVITFRRWCHFIKFLKRYGHLMVLYKNTYARDWYEH